MRTLLSFYANLNMGESSCCSSELCSSSKIGPTLKEKKLPSGVNSFLQELAYTENYENEKDRVASPESILICLGN